MNGPLRCSMLILEHEVHLKSVSELILHKLQNLLFHQKKIGPIILRSLTVHHVLTFKLCTGTSWTVRGSSMDQYLLFWLFM
jgi:hypothetical protein